MAIVKVDNETLGKDREDPNLSDTFPVHFPSLRFPYREELRDADMHPPLLEEAMACGYDHLARSVYEIGYRPPPP